MPQINTNENTDNNNFDFSGHLRRYVEALQSARPSESETPPMPETPPASEPIPEPEIPPTSEPTNDSNPLRDRIRGHSIVRTVSGSQNLFYVISDENRQGEIKICFLDKIYNISDGQRIYRILSSDNCFDVKADEFRLFLSTNGYSDLSLGQLRVIREFILSTGESNETDEPTIGTSRTRIGNNTRESNERGNTEEDTFEFIGQHPDREDRVNGYAPKKDRKGFQEKDFLED